MMDDNRCMVDTNVLIYSTVSSSPWHQEARGWLAALLDEGIELCIIPQIVREYLVILTRGDIFEEQFTPEEALDELEAILPTFILLIEGLLIARELLDRGEIQRICVLCSPYLCDQWQGEMREKFHIDPVVIRSGTVSQLERQLPSGDQSVFGYFPYIVTSIDYAKSDRHRANFLQHCPELVIVDEVHGAAKPSGQSRTQQQRHELLAEG